MDKHMVVDSQFELDSVEKLNSEFSKVKIRIAYAGLNRNGSVIPKELFDHMAHTSLKNIPIVGHWIEKNDNFGGHDMEAVQNGNDWEIRDVTRPFGVIPSDTEIWWEDVRENDGFTVHEYLNCMGILWSGRYPECEKILRDGANQSMEIVLRDFTYDEDGHLVVQDAEFSALCILGRDSDREKNIEPCFEKSCIEVYGLDEFKAAYFEMLSELKKFELESENAEDNGEVPVTPDIPITVDTEDAPDFSGDHAIQGTDAPEEPDDFKKSTNPDVDMGADSDTDSGIDCAETEIDYADRIAQLEALCEKLRGEALESAAKISEIQNTLDSYRATHSYDDSEVNDLIAFRKGIESERHMAEIADVLDDFTEALDGNAEFEKLRENAQSYSDVEELRRDCYTILGRAMKPARTKRSEQMAMKFDIRKDEKPEPYGGLFLAFNK